MNRTILVLEFLDFKILVEETTLFVWFVKNLFIYLYINLFIL
jgi:hypothetical protein